jgi:hypothetical protein
VADVVLFGHNSAAYGGGIRVVGTEATLARLSLIGNVAYSRGAGLCCVGPTSCDVSNTTLYANSAADEGAGLLCVNASPGIANAIISHSPSGGAIFCVGESTPALSCTNIFGNAGGDWTDCISAQYGLSGNISQDPSFCDPANEDLTLHADSPCAPFMPPNEECDLIGAWPVGCAPMVLPHDRYADGDRFLLRTLPNPFVGTTRIEYGTPAVAKNSATHLAIHDATGRRVRTLLSSPQPGGVHSALWDGLDQCGNRVGSGIYFARLQVGEQSLIRCLTLLR